MQKLIRRRQVQGEPGAADAGLHPLLERVYRARGVDPRLQRDLGLEHLLPPAQLLHADRAAALLADALSDNSRIIVIGDFDADLSLDSGICLLDLIVFRNVDFDNFRGDT